MKFNTNLKKIYFDPQKVREINQASDETIKAYDAMQGPLVSSLLTSQDISTLRSMIYSPYYQTHIQQRRKDMNEIMAARGFRFLGGGTNRVFYVHTTHKGFGLKIALDQVGLKNNIDELYHQHVIKPFCDKIYDVSKDQYGRYDGVVASCEAVYPITSLTEFKEVANQVFAVLWHKLKMKRIAMTDIGARSFKNWGIRPGFGPVMLDYPTMAVIDDTKCYCRACNQFGQYCGGKIDYSDSFDQMICLRCGRDYQIKTISKLNGENINELLIASGIVTTKHKMEVSNMKVKFVNPESGKVVTNSTNSEENTYVAPHTEKKSKFTGSAHIKCASLLFDEPQEETVVMTSSQPEEDKKRPEPKIKAVSKLTSEQPPVQPHTEPKIKAVSKLTSEQPPEQLKPVKQETLKEDVKNPPQSPKQEKKDAPKDTSKKSSFVAPEYHPKNSVRVPMTVEEICNILDGNMIDQGRNSSYPAKKKNQNQRQNNRGNKNKHKNGKGFDGDIDKY